MRSRNHCVGTFTRAMNNKLRDRGHSKSGVFDILRWAGLKIHLLRFIVGKNRVIPHLLSFTHRVIVGVQPQPRGRRQRHERMMMMMISDLKQKGI